MIEVKQGELEQLGALLKEHEIEALIARHKPQALDVRFDVQWLDREFLEYEADDFVVACGWRGGLIETLRLAIARGREHGIPEGMANKRLSRLSNAV